MRANKLIWIITAVIVAATVLVVATRQPAPSNGAPPLTDPTPAQAKLLIDTMLACLEDDPQARRTHTRFVVEAVAILAEEGVMETPETYFALGVFRYGQRWKDAPLATSETAFRKAIELNPDWALPHNGLGLTLMYMERFEEAEASFRRAIQLDSTWSRPHNDLAVLLRHTERLDEAEAEALIALSLDPDSVANNNNYGNVLLKRGRIEEAEAQYRKAIQLDPQEPAPYYNLACTAARRGDRDAILAHLYVATVLGDVFREEAARDQEFAAYRDDPDFQKLVSRE